MELTPNPPTQLPGVSAVQDASPRHLYHYTGVGGFLGMLKTKNLWFTHINFLNDSQEYAYALEVLEEVLEEYDKVGMHIHYLRSTIKQLLESVPQVYTFSFSAAEDLLSQWRAYCPDGGYSFSFRNEQIDLLLTNPQLELHECIYERDKQKNFIINRILINTPESYSRLKESDAKYGPSHESKPRSYMSKTICDNFLFNYKLLPVIKHPEFREEKEWRIIAHYKYDQTHLLEPLLNYRQGNGMIIPYLEIPIPTIEYPKGIRFDEVVIGPTPHEQLATTACKMLIHNRHSVSPQGIKLSKIPYRKF